MSFPVVLIGSTYPQTFSPQLIEQPELRPKYGVGLLYRLESPQSPIEEETFLGNGHILKSCGMNVCHFKVPTGSIFPQHFSPNSANSQRSGKKGNMTYLPFLAGPLKPVESRVTSFLFFYKTKYRTTPNKNPI